MTMDDLTHSHIRQPDRQPANTFWQQKLPTGLSRSEFRG
jgi:hypothetical protein